MRNAFISTLEFLSEKNNRIWLICGDLGYSVLDRFRARFPERFLNAGVSEQNMAGVAAGLAMTGKTVFIYSIANFPVIRCLEQIRNDICHHGLSVKVVSIGGGLAYGTAGYSHHATEDLAIMRSLPNMTVLAPGDPVEAGLATEWAANTPGPCYLRLGRGGEPVIHRTVPKFIPGKPITVRKGNDVSIVSTGGILHEAILAADVLGEQGYEASVVSVHTLKPLDEESIRALLRRTKLTVTIEEHGPGGLGSTVAQIIATSRISTAFVSIALNPGTYAMTGDQRSLRAAGRIAANDIVRTVKRVLGPALRKKRIQRGLTQ